MDDVDFEAWIKALSLERYARSDKYLSILREADDLTALILKGHLIVEELLTVGIETYCADIEQLRQANLRFGQRLALFRALERVPVVPNEFWDAVLRLNRLRNELAHNLEGGRMANLSAAFVKAVEETSSEETKFPTPHEGREALSQALLFLIGGLEVLTFWDRAVEAIMLKRTLT